MRITKISVTKLFGIFNHPVSLNMEDRITIIHGPNGVGKTALLRLINGFFNSQYSELFSIPFAEFRVDFDDCSHLQITKFFKQTSENEQHQELTVQLLNRDLEAKNFSPNLSSPDSNDRFKAVEAKLKDLDLTTKELKLMVKQLGIVIGTETMPLGDVRKRSDRLRDEDFKIVKQEPNWLSELKHSFHVSFIESQRLLYLSDIPQGWVGWKPPSMISSVDTYSKDLAKNIQAKLAEYGALSQSLDRTFPARVVDNKITYNLTEETLSNKLNEIDQKRSHFIENGLLDIGDNSDFKVPEHIDMTTKNILSVYIEDVEKKISIFDELATKIELFQRIIQQRFLYKKMSISKDKGFTFTTADGKPLLATDLSSGEQHELVMLYELLFNVKPNSLILIDEPELSLHVAWQVQFLTDLQAIIKLANFDVLIATHAPGIIEDRWDLTVGLKGQIA